jgi:N-acetylmuramoyl-L-alanine amidase
MRSVRFRVPCASAVLVGSFSMVVPVLGVVPASGVLADQRPGVTGASTPAEPEPVTPVVVEVEVPHADRPGAPALAALTAPRPVHGFGVVGATWLGRHPDDLRLSVRTRTHGQWSSWVELHGPHPTSAEDRPVRVGTDPFAVGEVGAVQLRATSASGRAPRDLTLSVVNPRRSPFDAPQNEATSRAATLGAATAGSQVLHSTAALSLLRREVPGVRAPRPKIRPRRAWGADERLRSGTPDYGRVRAGFVHHTVNANRYTRRDVPAIIRGIYAYHTQSLGWSDIGYNFLVDRFGRKWVGRYGGPRRAVIGAHTYGYNHVSTGMSAIGNFETRRPSRDMVRAFGRMMGWKLGRHGVRAGDRTRRLEGTRFRAINGHRDAGQTACPGIKLYRRLPDIRRIAIRWQHH